MATATSTRAITLILNEQEAIFIKDMMQNPADEVCASNDDVCEMRQSIFNALFNQLGRG